MVKMIELATGKEITFNKVTEAAKFLGMATSSLYNKYKTQSKSRGYRITLLELSDKGRGKTNDFKHFKSDKFKVDFYGKTAIISWKHKVGEDFDESYSYKHLHKVVVDRLREQDIFNKNFILLQETSPAAYTQLPVDTELLELYLNFKTNLPSKEMKNHIQKFLQFVI